MDKELENRLCKQALDGPLPLVLPRNCLTITLFTLEAIRAHVIELHPDRFGDSSMLEDAIEVIKDYQ